MINYHVLLITYSFSSPSLQIFMRDLKQWQGQAIETKALANKLLTLYANDDTHKVSQVNDNMMATWTHINKR